MSIVLLMAAMAAGSDATVVRCAIKQTAPADMARMQQGVIVGVLEGKKPAPATEKLIASARARAASCNPGSGKSDERAGELFVTSVAVEGLAAGLSTAGVDIAAVNRRLQQTPGPVLDAFLARKRDAKVDAFMDGVIAVAGPKKGDARVQKLLGGYAFNAARLAKLFATPVA